MRDKNLEQEREGTKPQPFNFLASLVIKLNRKKNRKGQNFKKRFPDFTVTKCFKIILKLQKWLKNVKVFKKFEKSCIFYQTIAEISNIKKLETIPWQKKFPVIYYQNLKEIFWALMMKNLNKVIKCQKNWNKNASFLKKCQNSCCLNVEDHSIATRNLQWSIIKP